jgi:NADP-dependent 3-hydroxy acid dehydrogenase YdfG
MGQLDGKTALVTGATSGIGLASARVLADEGAYVFLTGRRKEQLEQVVAGIGAGRATGIQADVTDLADLDRVMAVVEETGRGLDVLFVNAGIAEIVPSAKSRGSTTRTRSTPTSAASCSPCRRRCRC